MLEGLQGTKHHFETAIRKYPNSWTLIQLSVKKSESQAIHTGNVQLRAYFNWNRN
jgi:hypothetical protein